MNEKEQEPSESHPLYLEAMAAINQAIEGKGKERHGGAGYKEQPIFEIPNRLSKSIEDEKFGLAFLLGQALKKLGESPRILKKKGKEAAIHELHGVVVYTLTSIMYLKELEEPKAEPKTYSSGLYTDYTWLDSQGEIWPTVSATPDSNEEDK